VPGTMSTHVADTLEGTPFTDWVPKPNFHGPNFTYFDPNIGGISLVFGEQLPAIGSYSVSESALFCVTDDCVRHFGGPEMFCLGSRVSFRSAPCQSGAGRGLLPRLWRSCGGPVRCQRKRSEKLRAYRI